MPAAPKTQTKKYSPYERPEPQSPKQNPFEASQELQQNAEPVDVVETGEAVETNDKMQVEPTGQSEEEQLQNAIAAHTPTPPATVKRSVDWRLLTKDVLKECLTIQDPRPLDGQNGVMMAFFNFNLKRYYELTNSPENSINLRPTYNKMTIKMPFARMPFGINNKFKDEKSGKTKYTVSFSLYSPQSQQDLDDFENWLNNDYRETVIDLIISVLPKWELKGLKGDESVVRVLIDSNLAPVVKESKKEGFRNNFDVKIKTRDDADEPILVAWNENTKGKVPWNYIQWGDVGSPFVFFEGLTKVNSSFYNRIFTQELVFRDVVTDAKEVTEVEESYPLE